jgi:hypothetical protein
MNPEADEENRKNQITNRLIKSNKNKLAVNKNNFKNQKMYMYRKDLQNIINSSSSKVEKGMKRKECKNKKLNSQSPSNKRMMSPNIVRNLLKYLNRDTLELTANHLLALILGKIC